MHDSESKASTKTHQQHMREVLSHQAEALTAVSNRIDKQSDRAVELLLGCVGKIVVMGMGKCAHVAGKIAATLASTGSPAYFIHPAEAIHGDIGMVDANDVIILLSNSGETPEIKAVIPILKRLGTPILSLTGSPDSTLSKFSQVSLNTRVEKEGDSLNLAPMASTTVMLALGDAMASALMHKRAFTVEDYAALHPGGSLGQQLLCTVDELMHIGDELPITSVDSTVQTAIIDMTQKRLGATFVVEAEGILVGILTDGDLRRLLERDDHPKDALLANSMTTNPRTIERHELAVDALRLMEETPKITLLAVVDSQRHPIGALHIHDLIRAGIAR
jgi:arabinose-5-phosphate isomerase